MKLATKIIFLFIVGGWLLPAMVSAQEDSTLFREAKALMFQQKYDEALGRYELIKLKFPDSKYADDTEFWSAYILEQQGKKSIAFAAYQDLAQKYPGSPWVDDAMIHQIGLAEKFVKEGEDSYRNFLDEKLQSSQINVRYQAALSLGKLGDERARPALREMSRNGDRDMRSMAKSLLENFEQAPSREPQKQKQTPEIIRPPRTEKRDHIPKQPETTPRRETPPNRQRQIENNRTKNPPAQPPPSVPDKKKIKSSDVLDNFFQDANGFNIQKNLALQEAKGMVIPMIYRTAIA